MTAPLVLHLPSARAYAVVMTVLLVLFLGRVIGQILTATIAPSWLPPMARWYSGLMPYRYLLPTQIVFLVVMTAMTVGVERHAPPFGAISAGAGEWIVWASYVYALGMVVRSIRYARATPERRGVLIPIVFHFVLASFLFTYGSAAIARSAHLEPERGQLPEPVCGRYVGCRDSGAAPRARHGAVVAVRLHRRSLDAFHRASATPGRRTDLRV